MDLDNDECAPRLRADLLPAQAPRMCFRIAVTEVESWLMADRDEIARFLGVSRALITQVPDDLADPKLSIVQTAQRSRARAIRDDLVPRPGSGRAVGPAYTSRIVEFVAQAWRPDVAANASDSLARCLNRLQELVEAESRA